MNLTPELKFIQEKLVLAAHPWLSLEDALNIEIKNPHCLKIAKMLKRYFNQYWEPQEELFEWNRYDYTKWKIIWLPPSLPRVLNGLGDNYMYVPCWCIYSILAYALDKDQLCDRKLLNDDWSDATLFDQSEEIITAIAREMWYKSE